MIFLSAPSLVPRLARPSHLFNVTHRNNIEKLGGPGDEATLLLRMFMITWLLFQDVKVPVCPLCSQPVPVNRGEDPNIKVINDLETRTCAVITIFMDRLMNTFKRTARVTRQRK